VDDINIAVRLGEYTMMQLAERFLKRIQDDPDEWFKGMWSGREDYPQDLSDYLLQRFGGPSYFSDRKGNGALIDRHSKFEMTPRTVEKWLLHMQSAIADTEEIKPGQRSAMMNYFRFTAYFLVASREASREMALVRPLTDDMGTGGPDLPEGVNPPTFAKIWASDQSQLVIRMPTTEDTGPVDEREYDFSTSDSD